MVYEKGRLTRARIVSETGKILNVRGYHGTTVDDILAATGLKKGGLYRHFPDKDAVALEAYRYNLDALARARARAAEKAEGPLERLRALISFGETGIAKALQKGGCPILNLAVEVEESRPQHRTEARRAMNQWRGELSAAGAAARSEGMLNDAFDPDAFASIVISATEGAVAQSDLFRDSSHMKLAVATLHALLDAHATPRKRKRRPSR
jgi:AcrR family transcriptional regulator